MRQRRSNAGGASSFRLPRAFWHVWVASSISAAGDGLALVALPLLGRALTDDSRAIALLFACQRIPWFLLSLPVGAMVDRRSRRTVMTTVDLARGVVLLFLAYLVAQQTASLAVLCIVAFLLGLGETAFSAAAQGLIPSVVRKDALPRANGYLFSAQMSGEQMVGPALGGVLYSARTWLPFFIDALSFCVSAIVIATAPLLNPLRRSDDRQRQTASDVREAVTWFRSDSLVRYTSYFVAVAAFAQSMTTAMLVVYALDELSITRRGFGLLVAVLAVGNIVGGLMAHRILRFVRPDIALVGGALLMAVSFIVCAIVPHIAVASIVLQLESVAVAVVNVQNRALRQAEIPEHLIGKVTNLIRTLVIGVAPLGAIVSGFIAHQRGSRASFALAGLVLVVAATAFASPLRRVCDRHGAMVSATV